MTAVEHCRALIRRIDDLLHEENAKAAHAELHELAHSFEMFVSEKSAQPEDVRS